MNLRAILGFAVGPIGAAALGLITVPLISWLFAQEDVGRLNVFQVTISFALLLSVLGLDQAYVREYHETSRPARLLRTCFAPGAVALIILLAVSLPFASRLAEVLYGIRDGKLYAMTAAAVVLAYCSRFLSLILRMQERGLAYSMSQIAPKGVQIVLLGVIAYTVPARNLAYLLAVMIAAMACVFSVYAWNTRASWIPAIKESPDAAERKAVYGYGFPLIISSIIYWGITASSTYFLKWQSSYTELGAYAVAVSFAGAAIIFQSIFATIWAPTVYKWVSRGADMRIIGDVATQVCAAMCALISLVVGLSWVSDYILPSGYAVVKYIILPACLPPLLYTLSEVTYIGVGITRKSHLTVWIAAAALVCAVASLLVLVPVYGARGATVANALSFLIFFVARTEFSAAVWRGFPRIRIYGAVFGSGFVAMAVGLYGEMNVGQFLLLGVLMAATTVLLFWDVWVDWFVRTMSLVNAGKIRDAQ